MATPLEPAIRNPVRKQLLRELLKGRLQTLHQLAKALRLSLAATAYHLRILTSVDAVNCAERKPADQATYEANLDALPMWVRESVEAEDAGPG
jgi:predicted transcriptional regulator